MSVEPNQVRRQICRGVAREPVRETVGRGTPGLALPAVKRSVAVRGPGAAEGVRETTRPIRAPLARVVAARGAMRKSPGTDSSVRVT